MTIELPKPIAVTPVPNVRYREFTKCGQKPLSGGQIWTYEANSTTPKITYQDPYGMTPNTNPIILDAAGEADVYLNGTYRFVVKDKNGVVQKDVSKIGSWYSGDLDDQMKSVNDLLESSAQTLMQPLQDAINSALAAGAGEAGWDANLIADGNENQKQINDETVRNFESISDMVLYTPRRNGQVIYVKSYYSGLNKGGGMRVYDSSRKNENDGFLCINGWVLKIDDGKVTPEQAGAWGNNIHDDSDAINKYLSYGFSTNFDPYATYLVSKEIISIGQDIGYVKFNSIRKHQNKVAYGIVDNIGLIKKDVIKFCYVQTSYDLVEFLKIKSLGFNTIIHYFQNTDTTKFKCILNNAKSAGLDVVVCTEQLGTGNTVSPSIASDFIKTIDNHEAVVGYYLFDEPRGRSISLATQNSMIDAVRSVTSKPLWVGEFYYTDFNITTLYMSTGYDIHVVHNYAYRQNSTTTLSDRVAYDLRLARKYFSHHNALFGNLLGKTIIPCVGLFTPPSDADQYTKDKEQILATSTEYAKASTGHRGVFIWDALLENIAVTPEFQNQSILLNRAFRTRGNEKNYSIIFGSGNGATVGTSQDFGISQVALKNSSRNIDSEIGRLFPVVNPSNASMYGVANSPYAYDYAGILFRNKSTSFVSHFRVGKYLTVDLLLSDIEGFTAGLIINLYVTRDLGVSSKQLLFTSNSGRITTTIKNNFYDGDLIVEVITDNASQYYRRLMRGSIMSSEW